LRAGGVVAGGASWVGGKYAVALVRTEKGYSASCPGLPGCWSQGSSEEEALANMRDAICEYLAVAKQLAGERKEF